MNLYMYKMGISIYLYSKLNICCIYALSILQFYTNFTFIKSAKKKKIPPGPRTRSRANDVNLCEKDPVPAATRKKESKKDPAKKGVESSSAPMLLNLTCSKLLKQCGDIQSGSVAAYVALRERQKQNLELEPRIEDVSESSLPNVDEGGEPGN